MQDQGRERNRDRKTKEEKQFLPVSCFANMQSRGEGLAGSSHDINAQVIGLNKYFHNWVPVGKDGRMHTFRDNLNDF